MTGPACPARARARGFLPVLYTQRRGHCERGRPVRPARRHRTLRPSCPSRARGFFTFLTPREGARWAGAVPSALCPHRDPPPRGPTLSPPPPHGHHLCHYCPTPPPRAIAGPGPHLGSASPLPHPTPPPHPAGLGLLWGNQAVAFCEESRTPPRARPPPSQGLSLSPQPTGPRDRSWTNSRTGRLGLSPLPSCWEGRWGLPSPHLWLFPHPLEYPRKNKRQNPRI